MTDTVIRIGGIEAAPQEYPIPDTTELILKAAFASFDGASASASWFPCLRILAPGGSIVGAYKAESAVAAGGSADVSFGPFLGGGSGAGGDLDFQLNDVRLATEPAIDFEDGGGVTWQINDDPSNDRAKVSAIIQTGTATPTISLSSGVTVEADGNFNAFPGAAKMANDDLIIVYAKSASEQIDAFLVKQTSTDDGTTWSGETILQTPAAGHTFAASGGVTVLNNGRVMLAFSNQLNNPGNRPIEIKLVFSDDNGVTWSAVQTLTPFTNVNYPAGPILQLANGNLLMPIGGQDLADTADKNGTLLSTDGGATWGSKVGVAGTGAAPSFQEFTIIQEPGGTLVALINNQTSTRIDRATSTNNGTSWSATSNTGIAITPVLPTAWVQSDTQALWVVYRAAGSLDVEYQFSFDYGVTWASSGTLSTDVNEYGEVFAVDTGRLGLGIGTRPVGPARSNIFFFSAVITASRATRIVSGSVSEAGGVNRGHGFTAAKIAAGKYRVTFSTAFTDVPACIATPWSSAANTVHDVTTNPSAVGGNAPSASAFDVWITDGAGAGFTDAGFDFMAILT